MTEFRDIIANLRRPRLLIRAARHGTAEYSRDRDLRSLLQTTKTLSSEMALSQLIEVEAEAERTRKLGTIGYSFSHHISLLIALLAEARSLAARTPV
jgi:plasmid stability protein